MKVLFLCTENSARSIMAEALLRHHGKDKFQVFSAGASPTAVDENALKAIEHFGLSVDGLQSQSVDEYVDQHFDYVITLCDQAVLECENRIDGTNCLAWSFPEPRTRKDINPFEKTLQEINERIKNFMHEYQDISSASLTPTNFYKALADDIRLKTLLLIVVEKELCVCELMAALGEESQPKVSRHLAQLRKSGLLAVRKNQQWVYYFLNPTLPTWMKTIITSTVVNEPIFIQKELARLNAMGERPNRIASFCN
ncbi:metalloregulator ArsR/SmtB family transcription factor [Litorilituus lipolyticus]|uniref:ArsR family transcriptional regulator n=1 Tax=Litorilituus lipolyticus TaxID=2491017 RepID=A0A502KYU7_9GAMM|nr:metalloregulator ArsR/SmtB family transcription factor [Litorilituus lipolyticus]TPH13427.1 ArsR family transcriptional regulator [Litorilituus lipolyticus]